MTNPGSRILPAPQRAQKALLARFRGIPTPNISDCMNRLSAAGAAIRPVHRRGKLLGTAFTVRVPAGDNLMVHKALDLARPGDVIVVDAGGTLVNAIIGEIMTRYAKRRRLAGFVIDGAIRDVAAISAGTLPVYARGVTHRGPYKNGPGEINVPVNIGDIVVHPGDIVVGDADGVAIVPVALAAQIADAAAALGAAERATMRDIAAGRLDRGWVDAALRKLGCDLPAE